MLSNAQNQNLPVTRVATNLAATRMKPKDIFGLIVRLVGLIFLYESAEKVPLALSVIFPGFKTISGIGFLSALFMVGWPLAVAYCFFVALHPFPASPTRTSRNSLAFPF